MHAAGFCNQPASLAKGDGLEMRDARVTNVVHCAPPDNKPSREERDSCRPYLTREIQLARELKVIVALGGFAWDSCLWALAELGHRQRPKARFGHGARVQLGPYLLLGTYHPSQQNTFTGRLTRSMLQDVFDTAARELSPG